MIKSIALALVATVAAVSPTAAMSPVQQGELMYERYYYDDEARTIQVGYERDTCNYYGVGGSRTEGRYGPYMDQYPIAYCDRGQLYPL